MNFILIKLLFVKNVYLYKFVECTQKHVQHKIDKINNDLFQNFH